ncbi:hypothetical protein QE439_003281 [Pedobacter agri]|nr:hypothetical protein [Pedobacter agri]
MKFLSIPFFFICSFCYAQTSTSYTGCFLKSDEAAFDAGSSIPLYIGGGADYTYQYQYYSQTYPNFTNPTISIKKSMYNSYGNCTYFTSASTAGNCTVDADVLKFGNRWTFVIYDSCVRENLPLDDYIPLTVLFSAGFGFIFLRRSKLYLMISH